MRYRRLGRTGLQVSEISLGTVELGLDYGIPVAGERLQPGEEEAAHLLHLALDCGINLIDTAHAYGESQRIIGRAIAARRHEYHLVSKVQSQPGRPAEVHRLVEESLRDLDTDCIDVMMVHCRASEITPDGDTAAALLALREQGKIRFLGASVYGPASALSCIEEGIYDCIEIAYSVLDRRPEAAVLPRAQQRDVGVVARSVLLKGALTARYRGLPAAFEPLKTAVEALAAVAGSVGDLPGFAYRYALGRVPPHSVLVGTASAEELRACLEYAARPALSAEQVRAARAVCLDDERWLNPGNWPAV